MGGNRRGFVFISVVFELALIIGIVIYGFTSVDDRSDEGGLEQANEADPLLLLQTSDSLNSDDLATSEAGGPYSVLPSFRVTTYHARNGDNLWIIAKKTGLDFYTLLSVNRMKKANRISIGQKVKIPNQRGILYTLHKGEAIEDVALMYDVSIRKIIRVNRILHPDQIKPGMDLFIPGAKVSLAFGKELLEKSGIPAKFIWPVRRCRISSRFGYRKDPFTGRRAFHSGLDLAPGYGARVVAAMDGVVTFAGRMGGYGKLVVIRHRNGYSTRYGHLSRISSRVRRGRHIAQGQQIGSVGSTGRSTGPHLHFEVRKNGRALNPRQFLK